MTKKEIALKILKSFTRKRPLMKASAATFQKKDSKTLHVFFVNFTKFCTCERLWAIVSGYVITCSKSGTATKKWKIWTTCFTFSHFIILNSNRHFLLFIPCYEKTVLIHSHKKLVTMINHYLHYHITALRAVLQFQYPSAWDCVSA